VQRITSYICIAGCILVIVGFILPWYSLGTLPWYFAKSSYGQAASGWQMWLSSYSAVLTYAPHVLPELFTFLWLFPLAALLICTLNVLDLLFKEWNERWFHLGTRVFLLLLMGVFLWLAFVNQSVQSGLWLCFAGWVLILVATLTWLIGGNKNTASKETRLFEKSRRRLLYGIASFFGLVSLSTSGFLAWRNWRTHSSLMTYRYKNPSARQGNNESEPEPGSVLSVDWSPNGKRILVARLDAPAQSWDAFTAGNVFTYQPARITVGRWSPDGQHIALADLVSSYGRTPLVINATTGVQEAEGPFSTQSGSFSVQAMAWSPNSQSIAVSGPLVTANKPEALAVQIWHPFTNGVSKLYTFSSSKNEIGRVGSLVWSSNGRYLAANYFGLHLSRTNPSLDDSEVFVWSMQNGTVLFQYQTTQYPLMEGPEGYGGRFLSWSPDSHSLALANNTTVQILDLPSQKTLLTYTGHVSQVLAIAYSPNGRYIASGGYDWTVQVWEAATGRLQFLYQGHSAPVRDVSWSPDSHYLVSCGDDGTVQVWQPEL